MTVLPTSDSRSRFLAQFDGLSFLPHEQVLLSTAADTAAVIEGLEAVPNPPLSVVRELRHQRLALRQLLSAIRWPEQSAESEWGRAMARHRWKARSG